MKYGLPYKGSKNKLAERIIDLFPKKENLYDLFCGGGAITHCALLGNKFKKVYMNDINPMCTQLFIDSVKGKYKNEKRWISREDFFRLKDIDPYIAFCWSFGNNCKTYIYGKEVEQYKKALHYAIVFDNYSLGKELGLDFSVIEGIEGIKERRLALNKYLKETNQKEKAKCNSKSGSLLQNLERLQNLESLQNLKSLQSLKTGKLKTSNKSYDEIEIKPNSIIYCDIPYKDTDGYNNKEFDYESFYDWCKKQTELLFISSYEMPDNFISVAEFSHKSILSRSANNKVIEKIFIPKHQLDLYNENKITLF